MAPLPEGAGGFFSHAARGDEENLPLRPERFDLAVSALSLQNLNDLPGALVQLRRVLKPEWAFLAASLAAKVSTSCEPPWPLPSQKYAAGSVRGSRLSRMCRDMGGLMQRAGFALPVADSEPPVTVRYADMFGLMKDLRRDGRGQCACGAAAQPSPKGLFYCARAESLCGPKDSDLERLCA